MAFTYFFRDLQTLNLIRDQVLNRLNAQEQLHIWDAGCAYGQEPYSLAILLREASSDEQFAKIRILATDIDSSKRLAVAVHSARYAGSQIKRIPQALRETYFAPAESADDVFQLREDIRACVAFLRHDLCSFKPPAEDFTVILCKNVLLHLSDPERVQVVRMFHDALQPHGLLATEQTQKLPQNTVALFESLAGNAQLHRKAA